MRPRIDCRVMCGILDSVFVSPMARQRLPSLNARIRTRRTQLGLTGAELEPAQARAPAPLSAALPSLAGPEDAEIYRIPVLADGADPGRTVPSPLSVRDRLLVDRRLVADHSPERLFAYEVTIPAMKHLRGLASPGDRIVFQRGGRAGPDRICAVRASEGVVLSRVLFKGRSLLLLPGEGEQDFASVDVEGVKALPGVIAGTHVLLIRR